MKTWFWVLAAVVGGYLAYHSWFNSTEEDASDASSPPELELKSPAEEPGPSAVQKPRPGRRFDLGADGTDSSREPAPAAIDEEARALDEQLRAAREAGDADRARALEEVLLADHAGSVPALWVHFERGKEHWREYRRLGRDRAGLRHAVEAWKHWSRAVFLRGVEAAEKRRLIETLDRLARDLVFTNRHVEGVDVLYTPQRGDVLDRLCRKTFPKLGARVSPGFLVSVNGMRRAADLRAGKPIRVPLGALSYVIVKSEYRIYVLLDDRYVAHYPVGLGREGSTPEGAFEIVEKLKNPDWYLPETGEKIPFGDPRNVLGTRWLGFRDTPEFRGYGIHGTSSPDSIGKQASSGCVRMLTDDVERLYAWTPPSGTMVRILP